MTSSGSFEADLRAVVVSARPSTHAPASLAVAIDEIPARLGRQNRLFVFVRRVWVPTAAVGIALAAAALLAFGMSRASLVGLPPGVGSQSPVVAFDPSIEGIGLITSMIPTLQVAQWILVGVALALAAPNWFGKNRMTRRAKALGLLWVMIALVVAPTTKLAPLDDVKPGFQPGSFTSVRAGYDVMTPPDDGPPDGFTFDSFNRYYESAEPGGLLAIGFSIENAGPVPISFEGVIVHPDNATLAMAHWTAVWLPPLDTPQNTSVDLDQARPFAPTTVNPGDELEVFLIGRAGPCAFGPGFDSESDVDGYTMLGPTVDIAYSLAGLTGRTTIDMDQAFIEGSKVDCNG